MSSGLWTTVRVWRILCSCSEFSQYKNHAYWVTNIYLQICVQWVICYRHTPLIVQSQGVFVYSLDSSTAHAQTLAVLEGKRLAPYVKEFPVKGTHREHSQLLLVYRQEHIHSTHKQRNALLQTYFSQVLLEWVLAYSYNLAQHQIRNVLGYTSDPP